MRRKNPSGLWLTTVIGSPVDSPAPPSLEDLIDTYNEAWNRHDLDTIVSMHAPGMVFENYTAGERAEGDAVRAHIAAIFENWPDLRFTGRSLYVGESFVVADESSLAAALGRRWDCSRSSPTSS